LNWVLRGFCFHRDSPEILSLERTGIRFTVSVHQGYLSQADDPSVFQQILAGCAPAVDENPIRAVQVFDDDVTTGRVIVNASVPLGYCIGVGGGLINLKINTPLTAADYQPIPLESVQPEVEVVIGGLEKWDSGCWDRGRTPSATHGAQDQEDGQDQQDESND
jgi:hypothetical protein